MVTEDRFDATFGEGFEIWHLELHPERTGFRAQIKCRFQGVEFLGVGTGLNQVDAITCAAANLTRLVHNYEP